MITTHAMTSIPVKGTCFVGFVALFGSSTPKPSSPTKTEVSVKKRLKKDAVDDADDEAEREDVENMARQQAKPSQRQRQRQETHHSQHSAPNKPSCSLRPYYHHRV